MECVFCKIVAGEIPATKVYEDDEVIAFLDLHPINKGHTLIVPKEHYPRLADTPDEAAASLMRVVPSLSNAVMEAVDAKAFNLMNNNGSLAGQSVEHVHLHLMPRFEGDGYEVWHGDKELSEDEMHEIANAIRQKL